MSTEPTTQSPTESSTQSPITVSTTGALEKAWMLHPQVSVRPEPFGALLYHFGTRRLSFLKDRVLLQVVQSLADAPSARECCRRAGVPDADLVRFGRALETLAASSMIVGRTP